MAEVAEVAEVAELGSQVSAEYLPVAKDFRTDLHNNVVLDFWGIRSKQNIEIIRQICINALRNYFIVNISNFTCVNKKIKIIINL